MNPDTAGKRGGKRGPRLGSRPWRLLRMQPGDRLWLEVPAGRGTALMQQVSTDIQRNGLSGLRVLRQAFAIVPAKRECVEMLIVEFPIKGGSREP